MNTAICGFRRSRIDFLLLFICPMATRNAAFAWRLFNKYNVRYRTRVAVRLCDAGMVPEIAGIVATYLNDDDQFSRRRADLITRLGASASPYSRKLSETISGPTRGGTSRITALVFRLSQNPVICVVCDCRIVAAAILANGLTRPARQSEDEKYAIDIPAGSAPLGSVAARLLAALSDCGGRFDEYGNLWI